MLFIDDEGGVVAVVGGVEEFLAEGEAVLGADFRALSARDAWGCENAGIINYGGDGINRCPEGHGSGTMRSTMKETRLRAAEFVAKWKNPEWP